VHGDDARVRPLDAILTQLRAIEPELKQRYPIRSIGIFGSYVRGEQREDSDLDVLIDPGEGMTLPDLAGLQSELSEALELKVDVTNRRALRRRIGARILAEVRMV
jgi:uncharacterized protein